MNAQSGLILYSKYQTRGNGHQYVHEQPSVFMEHCLAVRKNKSPLCATGINPRNIILDERNRTYAVQPMDTVFQIYKRLGGV